MSSRGSFVEARTKKDQLPDFRPQRSEIAVFLYAVKSGTI